MRFPNVVAVVVFLNNVVIVGVVVVVGVVAQVARVQAGRAAVGLRAEALGASTSDAPRDVRN